MNKPRSSFPLRSLVAACLCASPLASHSQVGITDPLGDLLGTFAGSASSTDLDVLSARVLYNASTDTFTFSSTQAGPVGLTPGGFYVWGVNRGAGIAGFAANGITGVLFDRVVLLRPDGTGSIGGGPALPGGSVTLSGNTITGVVSGSLLPSTGFAAADYTFNVWPRDGTFAGFAAISDFAPDNANFPVTPVPEPETVALMAIGLATLAWRRRVRSAAG